MSKRSSSSDFPGGKASSNPGKSNSGSNNGSKSSAFTKNKQEKKSSYMLDQYTKAPSAADPWSSARPSTFQYKGRG
ncbi:hypothetical protein N7467_006224 [Penicillium canescens]|nr:hypothetical protein N7467_006224 [Penicillium canescens]